MISVDLPQQKNNYMFEELSLSERTTIIEYGFLLRNLVSSCLHPQSDSAGVEVSELDSIRSAALKDYIEQAIQLATEELRTRLLSSTQKYEQLQSRFVDLNLAHSREMEAKTEMLLNRIGVLHNQEMEFVSRASNSSIKGRAAEDEVIYKISSLFPRAEVDDCRSQPHRGDIIWKDQGLTMMIEIKDYLRNVQKSEIDKFKNDMNDPGNSDVQCGVMLSLRSGVCRKAHFGLEILSGKPVLFLHNWNDCPDSLLAAVAFFRMILSQEELSLDVEEKMCTFRAKLATLQKLVSKRRRRIEKFYKDEMSSLNEELALISGI